MRLPKRRVPEQVFPVTEKDWRDARHAEDPADRRSHDDIKRLLDDDETPVSLIADADTAYGV